MCNAICSRYWNSGVNKLRNGSVYCDINYARVFGATSHVEKVKMHVSLIIHYHNALYSRLARVYLRFFNAIKPLFELSVTVIF